MATKNESDTTRARANILREYLTHSTKNNPFDHKEIKEVLDLCLSCKGCKSECPSNVDMARLKAEFMQNYYDSNGIPLRSWLIGHINKINAIGIRLSGIYNFFVTSSAFSSVFKKVMSFAHKRSFPKLNKQSLRTWIKNNPDRLMSSQENSQGSLYLFVDEFTNYTEVDLGISTISLLSRLGFKVKVVRHPESGRAFLSKGLVKKAKKLAEQNVKIFSSLIDKNNPLVGIEPSAILSFRDEYPDLVSGELKEKALEISRNVHTIEEFIAGAVDEGKIKKEHFVSEKKDIYYHAHCHQKSLSSEDFTEKILSIPANFIVHCVPSGCCGMAGSFGFEKEHYQLSMDIGELVLFPTIRKTTERSIIAAAGTSCRQQILDGTGRKALHPVEVLWEAHIEND
jgi:Fe-S oxidoreductase